MKKEMNQEQGNLLQSVVEKYITGAMGDNSNWLEDSLASDLSDTSNENRDDIKTAIEKEINSFNGEMSSLNESIQAGDTKAEWLEERLKESLPELSENEFGETLFKANQEIHKQNEEAIVTIEGGTFEELQQEEATVEHSWTHEESRSMIRQLTDEISVGSLAGMVSGKGIELAEECGAIGETVAGLADSIRNGDDVEVKKAVSAALVVGAQKGYLPFFDKETPVSTLTDIASGGVEQARVMLQYADGDISGSQAMDMMGNIATVQVSRGFSNAGEKLGRQIGQKIGMAMATYVPFLAPITITVGTFVGAAIGKLAGSSIGSAICKAAKRIKEVAKPVLQKAWSTVKSVGRSLFEGVKNFFATLFD